MTRFHFVVATRHKEILSAPQATEEEAVALARATSIGDGTYRAVYFVLKSDAVSAMVRVAQFVDGREVSL